MPMETFNPDEVLTSSRICSATGRSDTGQSDSVPVKSRYASSIPAITTRGACRSSTARTSRDASRYQSKSPLTTVASGQSRSARPVGIPLFTPNFRAPYDAEVTTPRPSGRPPTMIRSTPFSSGIR